MNIKEKIEAELRLLKDRNPGCSPNVIYLGQHEFSDLIRHSVKTSCIELGIADSLLISGLKIFLLNDQNHFFIPVNQCTLGV